MYLPSIDEEVGGSDYSGLIPRSSLPPRAVYPAPAPIAPLPARAVVPAPAPAPLTIDAIMAAPVAISHDNVIVSHVNIAPQASLTGSENAPPTPAGANEPGLESTTLKGSAPMKSHWFWIVAVLLVLLGLWYFYGSSATA